MMTNVAKSKSIVPKAPMLFVSHVAIASPCLPPGMMNDSAKSGLRANPKKSELQIVAANVKRRRFHNVISLRLEVSFEPSEKLK